MQKNRRYEQSSDERLAELLKRGDKTAFVTLYERHKRYVYLFCLKMLHEPDGAKDVTQSTFLKVLERHHQLTDPGKFRSWLLTIARNDCITAMRSSRVTVPLEDSEDEVSKISATDTNFVLDEEIRQRVVARAIAALRPDFREVVVLREYQGLSYREIAEVIGMAESTVKFRLFWARKQLYQNLKPLLARLGT